MGDEPSPLDAAPVGAAADLRQTSALAAALGSLAASPGALDFESAFRHSPAALAFARDPHCRVVIRNAAMNRFLPPALDWHAWRLPDGSAPLLFADGASLPIERQPLRLAAFTGEPTHDRELELRLPSRDPVWLRVSAVPICDASGDRCGAIASAVEIDAGGELTPERTTERAKERFAHAASRARDELLAMWGHDLRNPMNAIATAVDVLDRAPPTGPESKRARDIIGRQTRRLAGLLDELSEIGRALADSSDPVRQPFELGVLLRRCVARAAVQAAAKNQTLRADIDPVWVDADVQRLDQAFERLLDDALRGSPVGCSLDVALHPADGTHAAIEIRGIAPGRPVGAGAAAVGPGGPGIETGIGMTLLGRLAAQHGGRAEVTPEGDASVVRVHLPSIAPPADAALPDLPDDAGRDR